MNPDTIKELARLDARIGELNLALSQERAEIERLTAALEQIDAWSRAYPLSVFPKPGLERAADLLRAGGMTLDAISASAMRYAIEGVGQIAPRH